MTVARKLRVYGDEVNDLCIKAEDLDPSRHDETTYGIYVYMLVGRVAQESRIFGLVLEDVTNLGPLETPWPDQWLGFWTTHKEAFDAAQALIASGAFYKTSRTRYARTRHA